MTNRTEALESLHKAATNPDTLDWALAWYLRLVYAPDDDPAWAEFEAEVAHYQALALAITGAYRDVANRYLAAVERIA